jgi:putative ABC transport system permease protein
LDRMTYTQCLAVALLGVFGGVALLLAAVGLYGVMSYAVSQSFHELGLRMALGAGARDVLQLVLTRGFVLIGAGITLGLALALGVTQFMGKLLYHISPRDPLTFCGALIVLATVAFLACLIPALRATRIDPAQALRG